MNKKIILTVLTIVVFIGFNHLRTPQKQDVLKEKYQAKPDKYELTKDPRYLACVDGANNVIQKNSEGVEKMIQITCKQIERMKIEDLKNSCLMGAIGLLHFIDHKEFHKLKGQPAIDWATKQYCLQYNNDSISN